jgi:hypothetical protein
VCAEPGDEATSSAGHGQRGDRRGGATDADRWPELVDEPRDRLQRLRDRE